VAETV